MTKQNAKAVYSSPVLEELETIFGQVLCSSLTGSTSEGLINDEEDLF